MNNDENQTVLVRSSSVTKDSHSTLYVENVAEMLRLQIVSCKKDDATLSRGQETALVKSFFSNYNFVIYSNYATRT